MGGEAGRRGVRWHKVTFPLESLCDFLALRGLRVKTIDLVTQTTEKKKKR